MTDERTSTRTWPELGIGLYDQLTGRGAEITYAFEDLDVQVPSGTGEAAGQARWRLNGQLTIRTSDRRNGAE